MNAFEKIYGRDTSLNDRARNEKKAKIFEALQYWVETQVQVNQEFNITVKNINIFLKEHPEFGLKDYGSMMIYFSDINFLREKLGLPTINLKKEEF